MRRRVGAAAAASTTVAVIAVMPLLSGTAQAITPPVIDPAAVPADGPPGPDEAMQQRYQCPPTGVLPNSDLATPVAAQAFMDLPALWKSAGRGAGVTVAVVDTGVTPSVRLPRLRGEGDYIDGGDGLTDCDTHGTVIASIIGAAAAEGDALVGVAPDADLLSIRQSSGMFVPANPGGGDTEQDRRAGTVSTLARAIVHAANAGARVINLSVVACIPTLKPVDQTTLGAAVRYAAVEKDAVLVTAAGNTANPGCAQNPDLDATNAADPRNWGQVVTISTPAWFSDYVLAVSATDAVGQPAVDDSGREISLAGPWISVGAPGLFVEGVTAAGGIINATFDSQKNMLKPMSGTSFAAAYVSGLAALIRGKYPQLPAAQVINRITATAHSPAAVVDNRIGHGVIDPLAALNADVPEVPAPRESVSGPLAPPPPPPPVDGRPKTIALVGVGVLAVVLAAVLGIGAMANTKGGPR